MEDAFAEQWEAARYNHWYWLSYVAIFVIPVLGSTVVAILLRRQAILRRTSHVLLAAGCAYLAAESSFHAISQKWQIRSSAATTHEQQIIVAMSDSGNLAFAVVSAPFFGLLSLSLWTAVAVFCGRWYSPPQKKTPLEHRRHRSFRLTW